MSPLTTTGMPTASFTRRTKAQSATPLKNWQRVRAWTVISATPASSAQRASSGALRLASSQPSRIFSVTGTRTAPTTASIRLSGVREIAHQGRARLLAGHLAGRAAHVDVDDVGAQISRHARPFRHPARLAARQLYDERSKIPANRAFAGVVAVVDQVLAGHHLGGNEAGAQNMGDPSERQVCHARHGREQHIALEGVRPNADLAALPFPRGRAYAIAHLLGIFSCCTCLGHSIPWPHAPQARKPRYPKIIRVAGRRSGG